MSLGDDVRRGIGLAGGSGCLTRAAGKRYAPLLYVLVHRFIDEGRGAHLAGTRSRVRKEIEIGVVVSFVFLIAGVLVYSFISRTQTGDWWPKIIPSRAILGDRSYGCDPNSVVPTAPVAGRHVGDTLFGGEIWQRGSGPMPPPSSLSRSATRW